ncbi:MAG: TIGR02221 family CRISPR-associated protein [Candidatus Viridilinea halotolerans]|uniref:TIGR02221 family CRISPR-associated protein n=1 Tax=Candidatus Viridilinea halotolerans TaxID=2491704 RepID=A0A426U993_9CHLR|nr:MAG: TIGR02221 family CRISPR-associated protein [Candidatus Viridilinea halotolerans]
MCKAFLACTQSVVTPLTWQVGRVQHQLVPQAAHRAPPARSHESLAAPQNLPGARRWMFGGTTGGCTARTWQVVSPLCMRKLFTPHPKLRKNALPPPSSLLPPRSSLPESPPTMPRKAITFLGLGNYQETTYCWESQACTTPLMAEATARIFRPDLLVVLLTPEAQQAKFPDLQQRLAGVLPVQPLPIPAGHAEQELWQIFAVLATEIKPGDELIFDMTNAFRSLPLLALLAANFVRSVRGATLERMIYGAFEARQENQTPIFDLTPFVALLDWTSATDTFLRYGRADDLAQRVRQTPPSAQPFSAGQARQFATQLASLTRALQAVRPVEVMREAHKLEVQLQTLTVQLASEPQVVPFSMLLERIASEYMPLALAEPTASTERHAVLQRTLYMVRWYLAKQMPVHALTLSREWLVSLIVVRMDLDLFSYISRAQAERILNDQPPVPAAAATMNDLENLRQLWRTIAQMRNDVAHTGMRANPTRAEKLIAHAAQIYPQLAALMGGA